MRDDLGADLAQVHDEAAAVLRFWFDELKPDQHWEKDAALDAEIGRRFGTMRDRVLATDAVGWRDDPDTLLAAVILLDQFSRNLHRGSAEAFAGDALAHSLAEEVVARGWDRRMPTERRTFLYMPFMHSENAASQQRSLALFGDPQFGIEDNMRYAVAHAEVIERFGRFPGRNLALGRPSTPDEEAYLSRPDAGW